MEANLICGDCKYFKEKTLTCLAFPKDIPDIIISGESDHSEPLKDQGNDIVFEPIDKKTKK